MGRRELVVLSAALGAAIVIGAGTRSLVREGTRGGVASSDPSSSATFEALEPPETSIHLYAPAEDEVMSRITCLTANLAQSLVVKRPEPLGEPTVLVVWNKEKGDLHGQKAQYQRGYVTSLPIVDVAARFYNDFLIVMAKDGSLEIERWLFKDQVGARSGSMPTASVLPGTPVVTPAYQDIVVGGGPWLPLEERSGVEPREARKHIASITTSGTLNATGVDPDGRYYLLLIDSTVYQYALNPNGPLLATFDVTQVGLVGSNLGNIRPLDEPQLGRVMYSEALDWQGDNGLDLALIDSNNDGVFDGGMVAVPRTSTNTSPVEFDDDNGGPILSAATRVYGY